MAAALINLNREAVCQLARHLSLNHDVGGDAVVSLVLAEGSLRHDGLLDQFRDPGEAT